MLEEMFKYKYNGRVDDGMQLLKNVKYMIKNSYYYLIRGNGKFGGIILDRKWVLEESSGQRKEVAVVLTPEGNIEEEALMVFKDAFQRFEPVYYEFGNFIVLTAKPHKDDNLNLLMWLPPAEARSISELKEEIRKLEYELQELDNNRQEAEHALQMERLRATMAEELKNSLYRQLKSISSKVVSIEGEIERIRAKQQAEHAVVIAMKEQVSEMINTLIKIAKEQGTEPYKLTTEILEKTLKIASLVNKIKSDTDKKTYEELELIKTELINIKNSIKSSESNFKEKSKAMEEKKEEVETKLAELR